MATTTTTTKKSKRNGNTAKAVNLFDSMTETETVETVETVETETETETVETSETETETETVETVETEAETEIKKTIDLFDSNVIFTSADMRLGLFSALQVLRDHANAVAFKPYMERLAGILKAIHTDAKSRVITALCEGETHVVLPREQVIEMVDGVLTGLDVADVFHLAALCVPICEMIKRVLDGAPMVTVIPSVLYRSGFATAPLWERLPRVLNAAIPFKQNGEWTCASKDYIRNSVQTWAFTQGCFIESKDGLFLIHAGLATSMALPTKEKRDARGTVTTVPKHAFQWVSKAARVILYARETGQDVDKLKTVCLAYGCPADAWVGALESCKPKASGSPSGSPSGKSKKTKSTSSLFDDIFRGLF